MEIPFDARALASRVVYRAIRRGWFGGLAERVPRAELIHEALVGMWACSETTPPPAEWSEVQKKVYYAAAGRRAVGRFLRDHLGAWSRKENRFFQLAVDQNGREREWGCRAEAFEQLCGGQLLELAHEVVRLHRRQTQGERDWKVLSLWLSGYSPAELAHQCTWLKSEASARSAVTRVVMKLRETFGGAVGTPLAVGGETDDRPRLRGGRRTSAAATARRWYDRPENAKTHRTQCRLRNLANRATARAAALEVLGEHEQAAAARHKAAVANAELLAMRRRH